MSLPAGEARSLARIERSLAQSDPALASLTGMFSKLTGHEPMPEREHLRRDYGALVRRGLLIAVLATVLLAQVLIIVHSGGGRGLRTSCAMPGPSCSAAPALPQSRWYP